MFQPNRISTCLPKLLVLALAVFAGNAHADVVISTVISGSSDSDDPVALSLDFQVAGNGTLGIGGNSGVFNYLVTAVTPNAPQTSVIAQYTTRTTVTSVSTNRRLGTVVIGGGGVGTYNLDGQPGRLVVNHNNILVSVNQQDVFTSGFSPEVGLFAFEEDGQYFNFSLFNPDQTDVFGTSIGSIVSATSLSLDSITDAQDSNYQLISSVPEPSSIALLVSVSFGCLLRRSVSRRTLVTA